MTLARRSFLTGLVGLVAAPAIVRVASIMPIRVMRPELPTIFEYEFGVYNGVIIREINLRRSAQISFAEAQREFYLRDIKPLPRAWPELFQAGR